MYKNVSIRKGRSCKYCLQYIVKKFKRHNAIRFLKLNIKMLKKTIRIHVTGHWGDTQIQWTGLFVWFFYLPFRELFFYIRNLMSRFRSEIWTLYLRIFCAILCDSWANDLTTAPHRCTNRAGEISESCFDIIEGEGCNQ